MIEAEHLCKRYADRVAVDDLSFRLEPGEVAGFLGPNGAGKSTTLRMLTGYLAPTTGRVCVGGVDAVAEPVRARQALGYLPESVPLYGEMRVSEYLRYRARLKRVPGRQLSKRVDAALEMADVMDARDRIIGQLSKGYRSRVGLADALVGDPPLLVLDEPTAGLDPNQIRQVRELIRRLRGHKTVLLSTHILPEVESTCERVLILHKGRLVAEDTPAALRLRGQGRQRLIVAGRSEGGRLRQVLESVPGVTRVASELAGAESVLRLDLEIGSGEAVAESVFRAVAKAGLVLRELRRAEDSLEDVFAWLTTREQSAEPGSTDPGGADPNSSDEASK